MAARIEGSLLWELRRIPNEEHHLYAHLCYARAHLARQDGGTGVTPYLQLTGRARSWHIKTKRWCFQDRVALMLPKKKLKVDFVSG